MDRTDALDDDLSPLEQRRVRLRAFADEMMETIRALPKPQTWLEGERAMRCIASSDRVVVQLFSQASPPKRSPARPAAPRAIPAFVAAPEPAPEPTPEPAFVYHYDDEDDDIATGEGEGAKALDAVLDALETAPAAPFRPATFARPAQSPAQRPASPSAAKARATALDRTYSQLAEKLLEGQGLLRELSP